MPFSAIVISLGSSIAGAFAKKGLDTAAGTAVSKAQDKLEKKFKLGKYEDVQHALEGARDDLLVQCETAEQREAMSRVLDKLLESKSGPLLDEFTEQVTQVYLLPAPDVPATDSLAKMYRKNEGPVAALKGEVPEEATLTGLLAAFFTAFRERLLREPDFTHLREYFQLTEAREQTDLLKDISAYLQAVVANTAHPIEDFSRVRMAYFDYLVREYKDHVIRGFSPRVSGRDVSLPLAKIFLPLQAVEGRPALAEYAEEELRRQIASEMMGELDWRRSSLEMEKRTAQLSARQAAQRTLNLVELLNSPRAILLGDPGTGKTTITRYVTYALASGDSTHVGRGVLGLTPVLIRLANYGRALERDSTLHLIEYVEQELTPKPEFGRYLRQAIEDEQCLIILDGLDEITDPGLRIRVTERIQTMVASYSDNRFLATSRIVGYNRSPLTREFKHATLKELGPKEQAHFVKLWYEALEAEISGLHYGGAGDLVEAISAKPQIGRLAANPLLLTIIVLMHWRGVKLPSRRVEIYQNATDTLIEYWTTHRGIELDAYEIKAILAPIAHYILSRSVSGVIAHYDLLPLFYQGIAEQRGCDLATAKQLGRDLLKALGEQSGIFLERGLDANSQPVYGFLHQTFGEYLAALHMADETLSGTFKLETYIHHTMWYEPLLLSVGHLSLVSQTHVGLLIRQILDFDSPYEEQLQRNVLLAADCLVDDIQIRHDLRQEVLRRLAGLLQHKAPQVRQSAVEDCRRLAMTRHREAIITVLRMALGQVENFNKLRPEIRFSLAQAFIHLGERDVAKALLWPLDSERYEFELRRDKVQRLRFEGWPDQAINYVLRLHKDKNQWSGILADLDLSNFILGVIDVDSARKILGESELLNVVYALLDQSTDKKEQANLRLLAALVPETPEVEALADLLDSETPAEARCLAGIRLLDSERRPQAISALHDLIATEPEQAPKAIQALLGIKEVANLNWRLLRDTAMVGDDESSPRAIVTLFNAGEDAIALPAALHLLALYPPLTRKQQEVRLWPVVESLIEQGHTDVGLSAARWLALRPGYYFRLQACEALLEAGQVETTIPLLQYLAYECHDKSSQQACQQLLLLKEAERIVPLLAQVCNSVSPEVSYQAFLALALTDRPPETFASAARPRCELKAEIVDERCRAYQSALQEFCRAGLAALDALEATDDQALLAQKLARFSLNWLARSFAPPTQTNELDELINSSWPAVSVNAALYSSASGQVDQIQRHFITLLSQIAQPLSIPVQIKVLINLGRFIVGTETGAQPLLVEALKNRDSRVRRTAVEALGCLGGPHSVQAILSALTDEDKEVRAAALRSLRFFEDPAIAQPIIDVLKTDEEIIVRGEAASTLRFLEVPEAVQPLISALRDEASYVRQRAASALGTHYFAEDQAATDAIVQPLIAAFEDESVVVRLNVALALGRRKHIVALEPLVAALQDEDKYVRGYAGLALGTLGNMGAVAPLVSTLKAEEHDIAINLMARGLWTLGKPSEIRPLIASLVNEDGSLCKAAAVVLGWLGDPVGLQSTVAALSDEDEGMRVAAAEGLGRLGNPNAILPLIAALSDEEPSVRQAVAKALGRLAAPQAVSPLIATLGDEYPWVFSDAAQALGRLGDKIAVSPLIASSAVRYDHTDLSRSVVEALGRLAATSAIPLIMAISGGWTAYTSAEALIHLNPDSALIVLDHHIRQFQKETWVENMQGQALWQIGDVNAALTHLCQAVHRRETGYNLRNLAHYYLESGELQEALEYANKALEKSSKEEMGWGEPHRKALCLLTKAVILLHAGEGKEALEMMQKAQEIDRRVTWIEDLQYDYLWREKAITALQELLAQQKTHSGG